MLHDCKLEPLWRLPGATALRHGADNPLAQVLKERCRHGELAWSHPNTWIQIR